MSHDHDRDSKSKSKRNRHKLINPVDATVSAHFPEWRKPLAKLEPLAPVRVFSVLTTNPHAGRSSFVTLSEMDVSHEYVAAPDNDELDGQVAIYIPKAAGVEVNGKERMGKIQDTKDNKMKEVGQDLRNVKITKAPEQEKDKKNLKEVGGEHLAQNKEMIAEEAKIKLMKYPELEKKVVSHPPADDILNKRKDDPVVVQDKNKGGMGKVPEADKVKRADTPTPKREEENYVTRRNEGKEDFKHLSQHREFPKFLSPEEKKQGQPGSSKSEKVHIPMWKEKDRDIKKEVKKNSNYFLPGKITKSNKNMKQEQEKKLPEMTQKPKPSGNEEARFLTSGQENRANAGLADDQAPDFSKGPGGRTLFKMDPRRDKMGQRTYHEITGDNVCPSMVRGIDFLRDPRLNKGMAFTLEERQSLGIHGLIPPRFKTQEEQVELCNANVDRYTDDLNKYVYLAGLQDRNERLFYRLLSENVEKMMPLVYTPTVGLACQKFGLIYRRPRGLFITIHDKGHIYQVLRNWPEADVRCICVTDGERILGLGDLGAYGMGIPVGKLALYTALAGIKPHHCLPLLLDVGTNTQSLLDDPYYIGLRHKRVTGPEYDEFLDEFMQAVVRRYGQNTLIQFEDFANHNAFRLLAKYRDRYCTFNDDIQGTASVAVAGVLASLRITKTRLKDQRFLFLGAGEAALGIAMLITQAMVKNDGVTADEAAARIFMSDSKGLIVKSRGKEVSAQKALFFKDLPHLTNFADMIDTIKPTCILGASAQRGAFTPEILKKMGQINERPIIFALSNPTSKAECTAAEAYEHTDGRAVFASGSPFPAYEHKGKKFIPGQGNNAYIFPGVALAVIASGIHHISEDVFLLAAETLANIVTEADLDAGRLYPPLHDIQNVSVIIAKRIMEDAYEKGEATTYPEPANKEEFLRSQLYDYKYGKALPKMYTWPSV